MRARVVILAGIAMTLGYACASFDAAESTPGNGADSGIDAGTDDGDVQPVPDAKAPFDAGDAGCRLLVSDSFDDDASATRWTFLGKARVVDGEAEIVPDEAGSNGAMWMNVEDAGSGVLHATFRSKIAPANGADGLTFAWSGSEDPTLGGTGGSFGLCGSGAAAVAIALVTFDDVIKFVDVADQCHKTTGVPASFIGTHLVDIAARPKTVDVNISGMHFDIVARRSIAVVRAIGFTAATGAFHARHAVDDVRVELCNE